MFSHDILTNFIRSYGSAMQGVMGSYLERNVQAFQEIQKRIQEQSRSLVGDSSKISEQLWSQFLVFQGPAMQSMMSAYMDQSKNMFQQMQEQLQTQTRTMFSAFPFNPFQGLPGQPHGEAEKPDPEPDSKS